MTHKFVLIIFALLMIPAAISDSEVEKIIEALNSGNIPRQNAAAEALGGLGPAAEKASPLLLKLLEFNDSKVSYIPDTKRMRIGTLCALAKIKEDKQYIEKLMTFLEKEHKRVWNFVAVNLASLGPPAADAVPLIEKNLLTSTGDKGVTAWGDVIAGHYALGKITGNKEKHIKALKRIRRNWEVARFFHYTKQIDYFAWELKR